MKKGGYFMDKINFGDKNQRNLGKERELIVVKHNDLIQKSRHNLSMQEQKIILFLVSKIKPEDTELKKYEFKIKDFCKICGIDETSGKNYKDLKGALKTLRDKSFWLKVYDEVKDVNKEVVVAWIENPEIKAQFINARTKNYSVPGQQDKTG